MQEEKEKVILVDEKDNKIGTEEKIKAHQNGAKLHRAFSIFIFNSEGEPLLQKRAKIKYHCPDLWTNTCCGHPRPGESLKQAVHRRLKEEMGFDCELKEIFDFIYQVDLGNGLWEWEFDHVFVGKFDNELNPDPKEVGGWQWVNIEKLKKNIKENSQNYTPWFKIAFEKIFRK